jgi:stage III sporulation protein AF
MTWLKDWLLGIVAAALAVALAQSLTPEGTVKKVGRLVGGLILLLAVVKPLAQLDVDALAVTAAAYSDSASEAAQAGEETLKTLIAQKVGAYIVDKGDALGLSCTAQVTVAQDEAGWPIPWAVTVTGTWTEEQRAALSRTVEEDLDIPAQRQSFQREAP